MSRFEITFRSKADAEFAEDLVNGDIEGNVLVIYRPRMSERAADNEMTRIIRAVRVYRPIGSRIV